MSRGPVRGTSMNRDYKGDVNGNSKGDFKWDLKGDFIENFKRGNVGCLLLLTRLSCQVSK